MVKFSDLTLDEVKYYADKLKWSEVGDYLVNTKLAYSLGRNQPARRYQDLLEICTQAIRELDSLADCERGKHLKLDPKYLAVIAASKRQHEQLSTWLAERAVHAEMMAELADGYEQLSLYPNSLIGGTDAK